MSEGQPFGAFPRHFLSVLWFWRPRLSADVPLKTPWAEPEPAVGMRKAGTRGRNGLIKMGESTQVFQTDFHVWQSYAYTQTYSWIYNKMLFLPIVELALIIPENLNPCLNQQWKTKDRLSPRQSFLTHHQCNSGTLPTGPCGHYVWDPLAGVGVHL